MTLARSVKAAIRAAETRLDHALAARWRKAVLRDAVDVTESVAGRSLLVVAPHPDDETIGCGGLIARVRALGAPVRVFVVCDGSSSHPDSAVVSRQQLVQIRADELVAACDALGVSSDDVTHLAWPDETPAGRVRELRDELMRIMEDVQPDHVLLPDPADWHPDHQAVHRAARLALDRYGRPVRTSVYPVWHWSDGPAVSAADRGRLARLRRTARAPFVGRHADAERVALDSFVDAKRAALACYRSQTTNLTGESSWATFDDGWLDLFLGPAEVYFPVRSDLPPELPVRDDFSTDRPAGSVVGSVTVDGVLRRGIDAEGRVAIDHGAARFGQLRMPGWGREALTYGPFVPRAGLSFAALVLNGHNTSQSDTRPEGVRGAVKRMLYEARFGALRVHPPHLLDNVAVGWFTSDEPQDVASAEHAFVMHAATTLNGELRTTIGGDAAPVHRGVQNLPIYYIVVMREHDVVYYVASVPGAHGLAGYPTMRPVGIDDRRSGRALFAGVHQSVLGEVGYQVATRIFGLAVHDVPSLGAFGSGSLFAIRFADATSVDDAWEVLAGAPDLGPDGMSAHDPCELRRALDGQPLGLLRVTFTSTRDGSLGLTLGGGPQVELRVVCTATECRVFANGKEESFPRRAPSNGEAVSGLQILHDGEQVTLLLDGDVVLRDPMVVIGDIDQVTLSITPGVSVKAIEALPRTLPMPTELDLGPPWAQRGDDVVIVDDFDGAPGTLSGRPCGAAAQWSRILGAGEFMIDGESAARVDASAARPCPGRTIYAVDWEHTAFADLEIDAVPPGSGRGQGEAGRGGVAFWQDASNYLVINPWLDDYEAHDGSSVSAFLMANGREDMWEAVWSNIGREIYWGKPYRLRVAFDGLRFLAWLNDVPVLYRAITDMDPRAQRFAIRKVGIATNWEWGDDTGTTFRSFVARR